MLTSKYRQSKVMQITANIEQTIIKNLRSLPTEKQQEVLEFTERLRQTLTPQIAISKLSLRQIAAMPLADRHQHIAPSISKTADDFLTELELTEFSILDTEDWQDD